MSCINYTLSPSTPQITTWSGVIRTDFIQKWTTLGCCARTRPLLPGMDPKVPHFLPERGTSLTITAWTKARRSRPNSTASSATRGGRRTGWCWWARDCRAASRHRRTLRGERGITCRGSHWQRPSRRGEARRKGPRRMEVEEAEGEERWREGGRGLRAPSPQRTPSSSGSAPSPRPQTPAPSASQRVV